MYILAPIPTPVPMVNQKGWTEFKSKLNYYTIERIILDSPIFAILIFSVFAILIVGLLSYCVMWL